MLIFEGRGIVLIMMLGYVLITAYTVAQSRKGKRWQLRRLPPLDAIVESIGRAVELGKSVHFALGTHYGAPGDPAQANAFPVLGFVAKNCAERDCDLIATTGRGDIHPIMESIVREASIDAGKPEWYNPLNIRFLGEDQWACSSSLFTLLLNENVATNFVFGLHGGACILYFEAGRIADCMNIGGMAKRSGELGFFAMGCDYFMVLAEMVAASAYISEEPDQLATVAGMDYFNFIMVAILIIGSILSTAGIDIISKILAL